MIGAKAPVVLFVFNRPDHTRRTLTALAANAGAKETDLIVYADGPRDARDRVAVEETRRIAAAAQGFRSVTMVARPDNFGLAENIAQGVSDVMSRFGRAIVLEDDIETSPGFLDYMNAALVRYRDTPKVWHISGWSYRIDPQGLPPYFFFPVMNCWGWATWADRWQAYRRAPERILREWSPEQRHAFDLGGAHDFFTQIEDNAEGHIHTWAVFWYATIFEAGGLCLNPTLSFTRNIGLDGSGTHFTKPSKEEPLTLRTEFDGDLPDSFDANPAAIRRVQELLSIPVHRRLSRRVKRAIRRFRGAR
ncbi:MAG: glycosyltransferase [Maritimibacter sp.]|nr:glycosyltransferase [Maritimibacter sp.]